MNQDYWLTHPRPNNPNNLLIAKRDNIKSVSNDRSPSYLMELHFWQYNSKFKQFTFGSPFK